MEINDCYKQMLSVLMYLDENDDGVGIALGYKADEMVKNAIKNATQANGVTMENGECHIQRVTHRAWIVEYTIDDSDVLQFNVTDAPNQLAAKAVAMYGLPRKAKLLNCSPVLHGG